MSHAGIVPHLDLLRRNSDQEEGSRNSLHHSEQLNIININNVSRRDVTGTYPRSDIVLPCQPSSAIVKALPGRDIVSRSARDRTIFWQGDTVTNELELVEGIVRAVHLCENGGRQILTFFWPGTVIDLRSEQSAFFTAETVTPCVFRRTGTDIKLTEPHPFEGNVTLIQEMIALLRGISRRCALSRIAWFLMRMRDHLPREGLDPDVLKFAVPRLDIADHLGVSLETVSRCLTELKLKRVIDLPNRKTIRFTDTRQLARIANG